MAPRCTGDRTTCVRDIYRPRMGDAVMLGVCLSCAHSRAHSVVSGPTTMAHANAIDPHAAIERRRG